VDSFIGWHLTELIEAASPPQEEPRLQVSRIFLDETSEGMKAAVHLRPSDLEFNLDEVGISDWDDHRPKRGVVPISAQGQTIHRGSARFISEPQTRINCHLYINGWTMSYAIHGHVAGLKLLLLSQTHPF
jgi:hypothetical protein